MAAILSLHDALVKAEQDLMSGKIKEDEQHTIEFEYIKEILIKPHQKKRIRKKWGKRYGTKPIVEKYEMTGFSSKDDAGYKFTIMNKKKKGTNTHTAKSPQRLQNTPLQSTEDSKKKANRMQTSSDAPPSVKVANLSKNI